MTEYKDKLPPRYKSWLELFDNCKDQFRKHEAVYVSFSEGDDRYDTTVDFIKARCFEEFTQGFESFKKYHPQDRLTIEIDGILNSNLMHRYK